MQEEKFKAELIAPCGMNCGTCIAFFGYTMNGKKRKHTCKSCRMRKTDCAFIKKKCLKLATKEIEYCFECYDYPCKNLSILDKRHRTNYEVSLIKNLEFIQANGIQEFLRNEEERWKCPSCGSHM
jgi:hypothetical protein